MTLSARNVKENIIKNTEYLIKSREGNNKLSFSERSGVTRSTVYKILNGKINNIQKGTVEKIADFFGVSVKLLEESDIAYLEATESDYDRNANPLGVPIINESLIHGLYQESISKLVVIFPLTYCYSNKKNVIGIRLEKDIPPYFIRGEILLVRRFFQGEDDELLVVANDNKIQIKERISPSDELIGHVIEERSSEKI